MKLNNEKSIKFGPPLPPFLVGSSASSPLKIWDAMPHYLKALFSQKKKNRKFIILTIFVWTTLFKVTWFHTCK